MKTSHSTNGLVGIAGVAYRLPRTVVDLEALHARGALRSTPATLAGFGFRQAHVAEDESHVEMALRAVGDLLEQTGIDPREIGVVLHAGALASSSTLAADPPGTAALHLPDVMDLFRYPVSRIQSEHGLTQAATVGVGQQGCAALLTAIRIGRDMLLAEEDLRAVLYVGSDRFPPNAPRELTYNVVSDAACAALLRKGWAADRILACGHVTKGVYWDAAEMENEMIAAYFPTAKAVIEATLRKARLTLEDIAWIVPHNVSLRSWEILLGLLDVPREKLFSENIARVGHTIAADNLLNLRDLLDSGRLRAGDRLLLFTFGYGLNWSCIVVEH
jgi:3-oxoacyl-[acyl-carrier-protein] synthase-3